MTGIYEIASSGLHSQQRALEVIANNIANVNTPSFKRSDVRFSEVVTQQQSGASGIGQDGANGLAGVNAESVLDLLGQGIVEKTGNNLDLAIEGGGFIELMGPNGQTMLWRGGNLSVSPEGLLIGGGGMALRAMISIPSDATMLNIDSEGVVSAKVGDQNGVELGKISLVQLDDPSAIERLDGGIYRVLNEGVATEVPAGDASSGRFVQGALERSNVDMNKEMVQLLIVQRAYAANAQLVQAADQFMGIANGLRK
jgi:flagellar basal-body rod protein FlgG